jgi:hypothetical protein
MLFSENQTYILANGSNPDTFQLAVFDDVEDKYVEWTNELQTTEQIHNVIGHTYEDLRELRNLINLLLEE